MKKLSFLELEREMVKEDRLIRANELIDIRGGQQSGMDSDQGFVTNDPFSFSQTTVVNNRGMVQSPTTDPNGNSYGFVDNPYGVSSYNTSDFPSTSFPTTTDPQDQLDDIINNNFPNTPGNTSFVSSNTIAPPGYHIGPNGKYINDATNEVAYGVVIADANSKATIHSSVYISPFELNEVPLAGSKGLIGHEIIHAKNIQEHPDIYRNNKNQFHLNSEYAAYKYQRNYYNGIGDNQDANACQQYMTEYANQGAQTDWDYHIDTTTTDMPTTTGTPTTTIPTTTT